jgi:hypothetical protein
MKSIRITSRRFRKLEKISKETVVDNSENVVILKVSHFLMIKRQRTINTNKKRSIIIIPDHPIV